MPEMRHGPGQEIAPARRWAAALTGVASQPQLLPTLPHSQPIKNLLFALTLLATIGTAAANDGKPGKKAKKGAAEVKMQCTKDEKAGASCCVKKTATAAVVAPAPALVK
ncbi:hypothetical protein GCM10022409_05900 [Hymenobacter glaciei]|uniref:Uncharacterized protein n=1 Tax=Hymenobacter glaciei TaxID=877209 RepID=A0ABP7TDT3_9BACT